MQKKECLFVIDVTTIGGNDCDSIGVDHYVD